MLQLYGFGDRIISETQYLGLTERELRAMAKESTPLRRTIPFSDGLGDGPPGAALTALAGPRPIGIGNPLSAEIVYTYTGSLSRPGWNRSDLLICSTVKQLPVYDAAPRAMQALIPKVDESYGFGSLPANLPGSPLLYYTPALTNRGLTVTLEMVFDRFPDDAFQQIGNMLGVAAGIPVFAPASAYLLAGSMIVKLFAKVAEMLVDGRPAFSQSLSISVDRPLYEDTAPGFLLLTPSNVLAANLTNGKFKVDPVRGLVDGTNGAYAGPDPYIVVGLDGTPRPDYADFTPTLATAAVLSRFLHLGDGQPTPTGLIVDALKAYNDIYYRSRADATRKQLDGLDPTSEEALKLKRLLDAYVKNIGNDDLKPKA